MSARHPLSPLGRRDPLAVLVGLEHSIEVVDVGANPIDGRPPYLPLLERGLCHVTGFEPQPDALARLQAKKTPAETYLPYAVGDGNEHVFHLTVSPGMASLLPPDEVQLGLFNDFPELGRVTARYPVATRRLDDIAEIASIDFLKIDIQGGELLVFEHGREKLREAVVVQTEVSFVPLYQRQPPFGAVDLALRGLGFWPHCVAELKLWPIHPAVVGGERRRPLRQLLEADKHVLAPAEHGSGSVATPRADRPLLLRIVRPGHTGAVGAGALGSWAGSRRGVSVLAARALRPRGVASGGCGSCAGRPRSLTQPSGKERGMGQPSPNPLCPA